MLPGFHGIHTRQIENLGTEQDQEPNYQHYTCRDVQRQQFVSLVEQYEQMSP